MSNPTSNFLWQMPTAVDLVTDLPADFEVFGQAVDTSLADLKGGTSGQILAKNTNADMDFVWITNDVGDITEVTAGTGISGGGTSGAVTITNSMATEITAKADLIVGTGNATFDNLPVGANGTVLTADSTVSPTGLKWATPAANSYTWTSYTPTYQNFTLGNGTQTMGYLQIDKIVFVRGKITLGSTSSVTGQIGISCPVTEGMEDYIQSFDCSYYDNSVPLQYGGNAGVVSGFINLLADKSDATYVTQVGVSATVPMTWAVNDIIIVAGWYQAS